MSFAPLPAPASSGASSIWARRMITKSVPTSEAEVELNVLSLLLDVPLASLDEHDLASSPVSLHSPVGWPVSAGCYSWSMGAGVEEGEAAGRACGLQRSRSMDCASERESGLVLEMHAAQTAVKAALDVLEEPSLSRGLRITTALPRMGGGCLTAPLEAGLSSPVSPAESCFSNADEGRKKGRARMSQEKRKRLARRREREALVATLGQPAHDLLNHTHYAAGQLSHSAPVTPLHSSFAPHALAGFPFAPAYESFGLESPRSVSGFDLASPALTTASLAADSSASCSTPASSPTARVLAGSPTSSSPPPTLVVQPPSPQRIRLPHLANRALAKPAAHWNAWNHNPLASVF